MAKPAPPRKNGASTRSKTGEPAPAWVRASDLAAWAYCRRAWWLARVQKVEPSDTASLEAGTARHAAHGRALARAAALRRVGLLLLAAAALAAVGLALLLIL